MVKGSASIRRSFGPEGGVGGERGQTGQPDQHRCAHDCGRCCRYGETQNHACVRVPPHQPQLEQVVGQMHDRCCSDGHLDRHQEREGGHQDSAKTENRVSPEARNATSATKRISIPRASNDDKN